MAGQPKQPTRNRKIEPLNWAEAANSPALKGMMSFLDIKPEEVRSGHFKDVPSDSDSHVVPVGDTLTGSASLSGAETLANSGSSSGTTSWAWGREVTDCERFGLISITAFAGEAFVPVVTFSDSLPVSVSPTGALCESEGTSLK